MTFDEIRRRLGALDTTSVCDTDKSIRVMDPGMRPVRTGLKLIGRAFTVSCDDDFLAVIKALRDASVGDVLVVEARGGRRAVAGELFTTEAARKGLAGLVVDGAVRDTRRIRTLDIPVYSRHVAPDSGTTAKLGTIGAPVTCGGVTVNPGDVLFGDDDGIVVASVEELGRLIPLAENIQHTEGLALDAMEKGRGLLGMTNFEQHYANVEAGVASKLAFDV